MPIGLFWQRAPTQARRPFALPETVFRPASGIEAVGDLSRCKGRVVAFSCYSRGYGLGVLSHGGLKL